jgi:hypothetical protein
MAFFDGFEPLLKGTCLEVAGRSQEGEGFLVMWKVLDLQASVITGKEREDPPTLDMGSILNSTGLLVFVHSGTELHSDKRSGFRFVYLLEITAAVPFPFQNWSTNGTTVS